jgi:cytosine/adenosine deaminase-related metal-dependent hydrolase
MDTPFRRFSRLLFALLAYRAPRTSVPPQGAALAGVNMVNPGQGRQVDQTIIVTGDRITSISPGPAAPGSSEAGRYRGAYVLPGLIEMHIHFPPPERELAHLLLLAHGVTSAREAGDADGTTWQARRRVQAGQMPGPRLFVCGPVLDGDPPYLPTSWVVRNVAEAEAAVSALASLGADFIKVHHKLSAEALAGIRAAAERRGLRVAGHVPMAVRFTWTASCHIRVRLKRLKPDTTPGGVSIPSRWTPTCGPR